MRGAFSCCYNVTLIDNLRQGLLRLLYILLLAVIREGLKQSERFSVAKVAQNRLHPVRRQSSSYAKLNNKYMTRKDCFYYFSQVFPLVMMTTTEQMCMVGVCKRYILDVEAILVCVTKPYENRQNYYQLRQKFLEKFFLQFIDRANVHG